jgi:hypothetical protein
MTPEPPGWLYGYAPETTRLIVVDSAAGNEVA